MKLIIKNIIFLLITAVSCKEISGMSLQNHKTALAALENPSNYYDDSSGSYSCPVCGVLGMRTSTQLYSEISRHLPVNCACSIIGCQHTENKATFESLFGHIDDEHSGGDIPSNRIAAHAQKAYKEGLRTKVAEMEAAMEQGD